jgi:2-polyprenyl-6-methoxyphenol hydroxylase-like FAD-dependent oxidoreductase
MNNWRPGKRVAIIGGGPGGVSAAIALLKRGFDVRVFEKQQEVKALGGAVLLSVPVLAILRDYGISLENFGSYTTVEFHNNKGKVRASLPFNPMVEQLFGIKGWHYGVLRSSAFKKMLDVVPDDIISSGCSFSHYEEKENAVVLHFDNDLTVEADIVIGADGINSKVSKQLFGDPELFHIGLRIWLAWCKDEVKGLKPNYGVISHSNKYQASYFPMLHDGKPGYEWWIVEPKEEHAPKPENTKDYLKKILSNFSGPIKDFIEVTDMEQQIFCWDVYNRPSLNSWSKGRIICIGDASHPVSPYAAYGMGMAIEDGYFLSRSLTGKDLSNIEDIKAAFADFEGKRVEYVNKNVEFARKLGKTFHNTPAPLSYLRDFIFDKTPLLNKMINKDYLGEQEAMCLSMSELHINK